ncbi:MAG: protein kinase, partial [Vicinamibacterales bacterium]
MTAPTCPNCGAPAAPAHTFCPDCGTRLKPAAAASLPQADDTDETAAIAQEEIRTGLRPALPPGSAWPEPRGTIVVKPAADATVMPTPQGDAATILPAPSPAPSPDTDATILQPLPDAATIAGPPAAEPRRPPTSGPGSGRPATDRPKTSRPATSSGASAPTQHMSPGDAFGARYRIMKMLGVGGMGAVYQAWDAELGVNVAIKTIRPGVGTDASTALDAERRFKRELLLAREVTHPNVVRIYDLGEIEGTKYITMSFVDGEDLATILAREGRLPVPRGLPIMRQVMAGMGAAHLAGIVHRDLKPANIMVDQSGHALVMDFGIARSVNGPATEPTPAAGTPALPEAMAGAAFSSTSMATHALTVAGSVMGTLDYMAPEQARGQQVDQRADVYALGLILRDVLLGRAARPKSGNAFEDLKQRIAEPLPPPRMVDPEFPEALDQIIARALELDPAARYQTSQELADALEALDDEGTPKPIPKLRSNWLLAAAGMAIIVAALGSWFAGRWGVTPVEAHEPVAVLIA